MIIILPGNDLLSYLSNIKTGLLFNAKLPVNFIDLLVYMSSNYIFIVGPLGTFPI